jgi:tetratricopeptide (TPR) repeat protein
MSSSTAEAIRLLQMGRLAEAEQAARAALARSRDGDALHVLGCIRFEAGARDEALTLLDEAIGMLPREASVYNNRARVLASDARFDAAVRDLRRALDLKPDFHAARAQLGQVHLSAGLDAMRRGDAVAAEKAFRASLAAVPGQAGVHNNLGVALHRQGRTREAIDQFERAVAIDAAFADPHVNLGNALEVTGDLVGARAQYEKAIAIAPREPGAWLNAASADVELGAHDAAAQCYRRALELRPHWADAEYGQALLHLRMQRFADGWRGFERRFDTDPPQATYRAPSLPAFEGRAPRSRVAVWPEQGIGDQILFSTLLPELAQHANVVAEVDARLADAYRRSVAGVEFVSGADASRALASCDTQVALGSLGRLYRPDRSSFTRQPARLLRADPRRVQAIRGQLGAGPCIAISWRSVQKGLRAGLGARKSIPLESFALLARARGARLVDVQYGDVDAERAAFEAAHPGVLLRPRGVDPFSDLEGVLAVLEACGEAVTASNAVAHLAGAAGVRATVVLLGARSPFHYWDALEGSRSLWYPSLTVARDPAWRTWDEAFENLAAR